MASQDLIINGKIVIDESAASTPIKSIKAQLKEANAELLRVSETFGETSKEAVAAAKNVAQLKDRIGDAKALTEAFSPDKKFQAFSQALAGVAGGFAAVQGAQALFGVESKQLEETLVKVQAAMALSQGLSAVTESIDAFKNLGTVLKEIPIIQKAITAAQWLWNAAMSASPVGAVVVAVTALIAGVVALTKYFMDNADAAKEQAKQIESAGRAIEKQKNTLKENAEALDRNQKFQLDYAKASGKSAEEIRKMEIALINKKIADKEATAQTVLATLEEEKRYLAYLKNIGANDEQIKAQEENIKKRRENLKTANDDVYAAGKERQDIVNRQIIEVKQAETNAEKEADQRAKERADKRKEKADQAAKDAAAAELDAQKQLKALKEANSIQEIADEQERAEKKLKIDKENRYKEIQDSKASEETKNSLILELGKKYEMDLAKIKEDAKKKEEEKKKQEEEKKKQELQKQIDFENETFKILNDVRINNIQNQFDKQREIEEQNYQNQIDSALAALNNKEITESEYNARREALTQEHENNLTGIENNAAENRKKIAETEANFKKQIQDSYSQSIGVLAELVGKQTAVGKGLALAQIAFDTGSAFMSGLRIAQESAKATGPAAAFAFPVFYATQTLAILQAVAKAKSVLSQVKGSSGGGSSINTPSGTPVTTAPIPPQLATTTMNQSQINQLSSATTRAFVLESDVTSNQERIIRLNRAARIN